MGAKILEENILADINALMPERDYAESLKA